VIGTGRKKGLMEGIKGCDRYWKGGVMEGIKGCNRYWKGGVMEAIKGCARYLKEERGNGRYKRM
jgi:hypothetical protein